MLAQLLLCQIYMVIHRCLFTSNQNNRVKNIMSVRALCKPLEKNPRFLLIGCWKSLPQFQYHHLDQKFYRPFPFTRHTKSSVLYAVSVLTINIHFECSFFIEVRCVFYSMFAPYLFVIVSYHVFTIFLVQSSVTYHLCSLKSSYTDFFTYVLGVRLKNAVENGG